MAYQSVNLIDVALLCLTKIGINQPVIVRIASRMFFLMSSIFCLRSSSLKPLTCRIRICFTIVLFPDSPAPGSCESGPTQTQDITTNT